MNRLIKKFASEQSGFTLIEILVATTVFVLASMMFMGIFATVSNTTLQVEGNRLAQQDSRYAIEMIAREVRNGCNFEIEDGGADGQVLKYNSGTCDLSTDPVVWEIYSKKINNDGEEYFVLYKKQEGATIDGTQLTSDEVAIKNINFQVIQPANEYPIVEVAMEVYRQGFKKVQDATTTTLTTRVTSRVRG